jgi:hypothetical protein
MIDYTPGESKVFYSEPTDPYWVQLLPAFSMFDTIPDGEQRIGNLVAKIDKSTGAVTLNKRSGGGPVRLKPTQSPLHQDMYRLCAILTQRAYDFRGQYNQQIYVATLFQDDSGVWRSTSRADLIKAVEKGEYRVSIIEVERPTANPKSSWPADPEKIWDELSNRKRTAAADLAGPNGKRFNSAYDAFGAIVRYSEAASSLAPDGKPRDLCELSEAKP